MGQMKMLVLLRMVPDVVEELEVAADGTSLDTEYLRLIANESDEHALEEALILRERHGGSVTVAALDSPDVGEALAAAIAKGADRVIRITGTAPSSTRLVAGVLTATLSAEDGLLPVDLVLTGCQAIDDLDGQLAPLAAHLLGMPYVGLVTAFEEGDGGSGRVLKEFAGGVRGRFEVDLPAVLGIQAAESPPRYLPVAKLRAAMLSGDIEEMPQVETDAIPGVQVSALSAPESGGGAEMLGTDPEDAADRVLEILASRGLV